MRPWKKILKRKSVIRGEPLVCRYLEKSWLLCLDRQMKEKEAEVGEKQWKWLQREEKEMLDCLRLLCLAPQPSGRWNDGHMNQKLSAWKMVWKKRKKAKWPADCLSQGPHSAMNERKSTKTWERRGTRQSQAKWQNRGDERATVWLGREVTRRKKKGCGQMKREKRRATTVVGDLSNRRIVKGN